MVQQYKSHSFNHIDHNGVTQTIKPFRKASQNGRYVYHLSEGAKEFDARIKSLLPNIYNPSSVMYLGAAGHHSSKIGGMSEPGTEHDHKFLTLAQASGGSGGSGGMTKKQCEEEANRFFMMRAILTL